MIRKVRLITIVTLVPVMLLSVAGVRLAVAQTPPPTQEQPRQAGQTWAATVGHEIFTEEGEKSTWTTYEFYPKSITINVGDSIKWTFDAGAEPHTVTFLGPETEIPEEIEAPPPGTDPNAPPPSKLPLSNKVFMRQGGNTYDGSAYTNSGVIAANIPGPKEYTLSFTKAGTYDYLCLLHAFEDPDSGEIVGMIATVVVQEAGSEYPMTQAEVDAEAEADMEADDALAMELEAEAKAGAGATRPGPGGTSIHRANVGFIYGDPETGDGLDYLRFAPMEITINQGDTVEWSMPTGGFHNVVFGAEPELIVVEPGPGGAPQAFFNLEAIAPAGGTTHTGTGVYNSAPLLAEGEEPFLPFPQVQTYSLTFAQPGRYEYICAIHYEQGMAGAVIVRARTGAPPGGPPVAPPGGGAPGMPRTGAGADWLPVVGVAAGLAFAASGLVLRRRRAARTP